jgi:hypothetical protein
MSLSTVKVVIVDVHDTTIQITVIPNMVIELGFQTWSAKPACCIKFSYLFRIFIDEQVLTPEQNICNQYLYDALPTKTKFSKMNNEKPLKTSAWSYLSLKKKSNK